jgi:hypothetical protein
MEQSLDRIENLLRSRRGAGTVDAVEDSLPEDSHRELLEMLMRLRACLEDFATEFGLRSHVMDIRQILNAELSTAWVMLENCRPKRMKGYGVPFDKDVRQAIEGGVEELLAQVRELQKLVR